MESDQSDGIDPLLLRRRQLKQRSRKRLLIIAGVVGIAGFIGVVVFVGFLLSRKAGPAGPGLFGASPDKEGETWTAVDLRDYLRSKGLKVWMGDYSPRSPATGRHQSHRLVFVFGNSEVDSKNLVTDIENQVADTGLIVCYRKADTAEQAREAAGLSPKTTFAWGRYVFWVEDNWFDPTLRFEKINAIHEALTGKPFKSRP